MELLQQVEVNEGHLLASIDVNSLYTNIQQQHAIEAVVWALNSTKMKNKQKDFMVHALDLAMSHDFFWHDKHSFRQKKGVAMGAKYAPFSGHFIHEPLGERCHL